MAGVSQRKVTDGINWGGLVDLGNGMSLYAGTGVFGTTDTTVTINHPFKQIISVQATPIAAAYDADDQLVFTLGTSANTLKQDATYGILTPVTANKAQVLRNSSGTSALAFAVQMIGIAK